jgi:hypothetical protein
MAQMRLCRAWPQDWRSLWIEGGCTGPLTVIPEADQFGVTQNVAAPQNPPLSPCEAADADRHGRTL